MTDRTDQKPRKDAWANWKSALTAFLSDRSGNTTVIFAGVITALLAAAGTTIEYTRLLNHKSKLQTAADAAAIAGANEMYIAQADGSRVEAVVKSIVDAKFDSSDVTAETKSDYRNGTVNVTLSETVALAFAGVLGVSESAVAVTAEAKVVGSGRICVIGLESKSAGTISLEHYAVMEASECSVFSNSKNNAGLKAKGGSRLYSELTCSSGGTAGSHGNFKPQPLTDCPPIPDPLASRPPPSVGACSYNNLTIEKGVHVLIGGTYCGGLRISGSASVTLKPGIYVMKNGPLDVSGSAQLRGKYSGFYFVGSKATLSFARDTTIDLSAPKTGSLAGLLFFQDQNAKAGEKFHITSNNARNLLGTIYLPKGRLYIDADADIARQSAYTAVVAYKIELSEGPVLHLNTDYSGTDIPVPPGVGPVGSNIMLTR